MTGQPKSRIGEEPTSQLHQVHTSEKKMNYVKERDDLGKIHTFLDIEVMLLD